MNHFFNDKLHQLQDKAKAAYQDLVGKVPVISKMVAGLPIVASFEKVNNSEFDEKHYFVIPYKLSEYGIALHTMRSLPVGAPEVNDLPKRRVFHFYNQHAQGQLKQYLLAQAEEVVLNQEQQVSSIESLADNIDALDNKLTYGMLLIGGLSALINPLLGAAIAAKALLPSFTGLLNKHGLKPLGEKLTKTSLQSQVECAREKVQQDFAAANTIKVQNPILMELDLALKTNEQQHDPLLDFDLSQLDIEGIDRHIWQPLTIKALQHVYQDILKDKSKHQQAALGPEELRWFEVLLANNDKP